MDKKVLVLDLDGTLTNSEKKINAGDEKSTDGDAGAGTHGCACIRTSDCRH